MKNKTKNGWIETDKDYFWTHRKDGKDSGLTIAHISPKVYHVRYYPPNQPNKDYDIGSRSTLTRAKRLAESILKKEGFICFWLFSHFPLIYGGDLCIGDIQVL